MFVVDDTIQLADDELEWQAIRAQGAGGQNVNKVSSAIHLRFDIAASSLPDDVKQRLLSMNDRRINNDGVLVIKAQRHRTREKNRDDALERLRGIIIGARHKQKKRIATRPTRASQKRRLDNKTQRGRTKRLRGPIEE